MADPAYQIGPVAYQTGPTAYGPKPQQPETWIGRLSQTRPDSRTIDPRATVVPANPNDRMLLTQPQRPEGVRDL